MNLSFLTDTALFRGVEPAELEALLQGLTASAVCYEKGQFIHRCGQTVDSIGLVLSGSVLIESDDLWGNRTLMGHAAAGQIFGEAYACCPGEPLLVQVVAAEKTEVMFFSIQRMLSVCSHSSQLLRNLLQITAQKNLQLSRRILCTTPKSIRGRLMIFLSDQAKRRGSYTVTIPYNRQQLADYLGLDRSALSNELSKMQREGLLRYEKNTFYLREAAILP